MPRLVCVSGMNKGEERELAVPGELSLGRSEKNDICVLDRKSSRHHCKIVATGADIVLEDMNSTNGVSVNGKRVEISAGLQLGDLIRIGQTEFLLEEGQKGVKDGEDQASLKMRRKCETLLHKTSFQVTQTTSLQKIRAGGEDLASTSEPAE